jgi:hypothetical protein
MELDGRTVHFKKHGRKANNAHQVSRCLFFRLYVLLIAFALFFQPPCFASEFHSLV